jgi:hypothetical protein
MSGLAALALMAVPVFGHHGTATSFDSKKVVEMKGTVKEFRWRNPHCELVLDGKDETGKAVSMSVEMGSPGQLVMTGMTRNTFKPGDEVVLEVHPSFVNPALGEKTNGKVFVNGKEVSLTAIRAE